uniref:Uncharacterized protein n=1 Tax=Arundo donax TaxID=35708 RepID=A0A0A9SMA5_ARUDO
MICLGAEEVVTILIISLPGFDGALTLLPLLMVLASGAKNREPSSTSFSNLFRTFFNLGVFLEMICFARFIADLVGD